MASFVCKDELEKKEIKMDENSDTLNDNADTLEDISDTLKDISNTLEDAVDTLNHISDTLDDAAKIMWGPIEDVQMRINDRWNNLWMVDLSAKDAKFQKTYFEW